jgi:hypothetical protein
MWKAPLRAPASARLNSTMAVPSLNRLGFEQELQALGDTKAAEDRQHGDRVGGGDQRAEDQRQGECHPAGPCHDASDDGHRQQDAWDRQQEDRHPVPAQVAQREMECRLEDQRRQE